MPFCLRGPRFLNPHSAQAQNTPWCSFLFGVWNRSHTKQKSFLKEWHTLQDVIIHILEQIKILAWLDKHFIEPALLPVLSQTFTN